MNTMLKQTRSRRSRRGNVLLLVTLTLPLVVGLVGLAIDGTMCFIVQTQLSAAVDGAALGTGRMLSGITGNTQAQDIAQDFLNANFHGGGAGFWGAQIVGTASIVADTVSITKTVKVTASASVPLLFMRIFSDNFAGVAATGTASRRDARIEMILDRSGSMTALEPSLKTYAESFVQGFNEGSDEMGLIVFSDSAVVAYPPTTAPPYSQSITGGTCPSSPCGPDGNFNDGTANDMVNQIEHIAVQSDTNMGDALALAYLELQKAHERDMTQNHGVDSRQNYVVLFTDGVPNTVSVYLNNPLDPRNLTNPTSLVLNSAGTGCSAASLLNTSGNFPITGSVQSTQTSSFFQLAALDPNHTSNQYVSASTGYDSSYASTPNPGSYGCTQANLQNLSSLRTIPSIDAYGYPLGPNMETGTAGYKYSYYLNAVASQAPVIWDNKTEWGGDPTSPQPITQKLPAESAAAYQWTLADWDDVDNIASAIRSDAHYAARGDSAPMVISIMTVGYTGDGGTDAGLLSKIANVSGCSIKNPYNVTLNCVVTTGANGTKEQNGVFIPASNTTELNDAFSTLMSTILRLSQ